APPASSSRRVGRRTAKPTTASPSPASRLAASPRARATPPAPTTAILTNDRGGESHPARPLAGGTPRAPPLPRTARPLEAYMVDFRKLKVLTPAERAAQEDGHKAQGRLSTVSK